MPTSVLRRYTPPTCTLEIAATGSALSRWTDRTMLKNVRFQLSFDDPKLSPDQQITIRGDRQQLEALKEAVEIYVQKLLSQSPDEIPAWNSNSTTNSTTNGTTNGIPNANATPANAAANSAAATAAAIEASLAQLRAQDGLRTSDHLRDGDSDSAFSLADSGIYLQPQGLTAHQLHLGALADQAADKIVPLSTTQLFDLANALDDYSAEADTLPELSRPTWIKSPATWGKVAAGLVAASAVGGTMVYFVRGISAPTAQTASLQQTRETQSSIAARPPGSTPTLPPPPAPLTTSPALQPLPPTALPAPGSTIAPDPAPAALPQAPLDDFSSVAVAPAVPAPIAPIEIPVRETVSPVEPVRPAPSNETANTPPSLLAEARQNAANQSASAESFEAAATNPNSNLSFATGTRVRTSTTPNADAADANASASAGATPSSALASRAAAGASAASARAGVSAQSQLGEVENYFRNNWQPIAGLTTKLEYRVLLSPDGSLQRIDPIGDTSGQYIDRVQIPLMGEPFISPNQNNQSPQFRVVLEPDGQVRVFLEYEN